MWKRMTRHVGETLSNEDFYAVEDNCTRLPPRTQSRQTAASDCHQHPANSLNTSDHPAMLPSGQTFGGRRIQHRRTPGLPGTSPLLHPVSREINGNEDYEKEAKEPRSDVSLKDAPAAGTNARSLPVGGGWIAQRSFSLLSDLASKPHPPKTNRTMRDAGPVLVS